MTFDNNKKGLRPFYEPIYSIFAIATMHEYVTLDHKTSHKGTFF